MKIERNNSVVAFKEIKNKVGTCFAFEDKVFMILPLCYSKNHTRIIALNLENNYFVFYGNFSDDELITVLNLKIVEE